MHVLRDGTMAAGQARRQHDGSADPGRRTYQGHPQGRLARGFFMGRSVNQDVMLADIDVLLADDHCRMAHGR